jgi:hypothetical protein
MKKTVVISLGIILVGIAALYFGFRSSPVHGGLEASPYPAASATPVEPSPEAGEAPSGAPPVTENASPRPRPTIKPGPHVVPSPFRPSPPFHGNLDAGCEVLRCASCALTHVRSLRSNTPAVWSYCRENPPTRVDNTPPQGWTKEK